MRRLKKPAVDAATVFSKCITGVKTEQEKLKLTSVAPLIAEAAIRYNKYASLMQLHLLKREIVIGGTVTIEEMKTLYSSAMSSPSGTARPHYDEIVGAAPNRICPLCGIGTVSSLDHHLPQSKYPEYILVPLNLVPSCFDCNKAKLTKFPKQPGQQTIHPYFDDYTQDTWLHAKVIEMSPPALLFYVDTPNHWPAVDSERVKRHFDVFRLGRLFTSNAGNELGTIRSHLTNHLAGDESAVTLYLREQAASCRNAYLNSWRTAAYEALSTNFWFVGGGYHEIPVPS